MSTKIGLISDTHSTTAPLKDAFSIFAREKVDNIICAGDIAGYGEDQLEETIDLLQANNCLMISGNHDYYDATTTPESSADKIIRFFDSLPTHLELTIENKHIYVVHASPPDAQHDGIKLLDPEGRVFEDRKKHWADELKDFEYDILIVGHTHQVFCETLGKTLVINPGSTTFNHNCSILHLPDMHVQNFALSGKISIKVWNWSMLHA